MDRNMMIRLMEENPGVKITHELFGTDEFIYQKIMDMYMMKTGISLKTGIRLVCAGMMV